MMTKSKNINAKQFNCLSSVEREEDVLIAKTIVLDGCWEGEGLLKLNLYSFQIQDAQWEIHDKRNNKNSRRESLPELIGCSGYIQGKKELKKLQSKKDGEKIKYLFEQCINGVIQGETFVYKERGFDSEKSYNEYWDVLEENGCRMYSNPRAEDLPWTEYVGSINRKCNLFNRFKRVCFFQDASGKIQVDGSFSDTYHELQVGLQLDPETLAVLTCDLNFLRAPGQACFDNSVNGTTLIGKVLPQLTKRDLIDFFGRSHGCYHVVDIMVDIHRKIKSFQGLTEWD